MLASKSDDWGTTDTNILCLLRNLNPQIINDTELSELLNDLKWRYNQVRDQLERVSFQNKELFDLLSKYVEQLDEQTFQRDVLEMDLDQHKEALANTSRELAEKTCVIEAQEYLLLSTREEIEDLANASAEKEHLIASLLAQVEQKEIEKPDGERAKKRKTFA